MKTFNDHKTFLWLCAETLLRYYINTNAKRYGKEFNFQSKEFTFCSSTLHWEQL